MLTAREVSLAEAIELSQFYRGGVSLDQLASVAGLSRQETYKQVLRGDRARAAEIAALYQGGCTLQEIGDELGLTRERVRQIVQKVGVRRPKNLARVRLEEVAPNSSAPSERRFAIEAGIAAYKRKTPHERRQHIREAIWQLCEQLGRSPSLTEIGRALGCKSRNPSGQVQSLMATAWGVDTLAQAASMAYNAAGVPQPRPGRDYGYTKGAGKVSRSIAATPRAPTADPAT